MNGRANPLPTTSITHPSRPHVCLDTIRPDVDISA
jgi:hypothetical protein